MSDQPEWRWEDHPDVWLSDLCANGQCSRCHMNRFSCGHPCHTEADKGGA